MKDNYDFCKRVILGRATDRPSTDFEYVFLLSKSPRYYFDMYAIKEPQKEVSLKRAFSNNHLEIRKDQGQNTYALSSQAQAETLAKLRHAIETGGDTRRNKRSTWIVPIHSYKEAHFATFPVELITPMILAGTPFNVCSKCGAPWVRVIKKEYEYPNPAEYGTMGERGSKWKNEDERSSGHRLQKNVSALRAQGHGHDNTFPPQVRLGWCPTCDCDAEPTRAIVGDPFMGAGMGLDKWGEERDDELQGFYAALL